jgi:IS5 family transposase
MLFLVVTEGASMLSDPSSPRLSEFDLQVYRAVVPQDHYLRKALHTVPWDDFHDLLAPFYSPDMGRPAESPVLMLKLEYLRYHHNLSDREVHARGETDLAFRYFLQLPLRWALPDPSSLCVFRGRLGRKGFRKVFDRVVAVARQHGVVKDRLRIKDATHVVGNMAVPTALALVAQVRDKLLAAAEPFDPLLVEGEQVNLETLRETTKSLKPAERLASRLAQLREMLVWADNVAAPEESETNRAWQAFLAQRDLAHKILDDQEHPGAGDRTLSTTDPDARRAKHGEWFDGYLLDIVVDADSEIITQINVLPGNGDEAADAAKLIRQEEAAHGNDVVAISIDGAGFNGAVLRELEDPNDLDLDAYVPPGKESETGLFTPKDFEEDAEQSQLICPAGQTSKYRQRDNKNHTTVYRFDASVCRACPLMDRCVKETPQKAFGRTVRKTDYQVEYQRARDKATTEAYAVVRREHMKVERKLGEVMNCHGGRRARYRGRWKVLSQELMACTATNVKRLVRLVSAPIAEISCQL